MAVPRKAPNRRPRRNPKGVESTGQPADPESHVPPGSPIGPCRLYRHDLHVGPYRLDPTQNHVDRQGSVLHAALQRRTSSTGDGIGILFGGPVTDRLTLDEVIAIDFHTHVEIGADGRDHLDPGLRAALSAYFGGDHLRPTAQDVADYYRRRKMMAVVFTVDWELTSDRPRIGNDEIVAAAEGNDDVLIPFASIDPRRGEDGVAEARGLLANGSVRGFKFHPNLQQFHPNDPMAYPLYEVIADAGAIALFHTGHSGIGTGVPGGAGVRLKYSNPMTVDDVAVDFPEMRIVLAHPSFPWQDEALSIALHKPGVFLDLSGWSPKRFPQQLVAYARGRLRDKTLFGSDFPFITPDRWIADFETLGLDEETSQLILKDNAVRLLAL